MKTPLVIPALLTAITTLVPVTEAAAAQPTYPGMMCQRVGGGNATSYSNGHAQNLTNGTQYLECPIVDDPTGVSTVDPVIFVTDRHETSNVCCSSGLKHVSTSLFFGANDCSSGSSTSYQHLSPVHVVNFFGSWAHRYYRCSLPGVDDGVSEVRTYRY